MQSFFSRFSPFQRIPTALSEQFTLGKMGSSPNFGYKQAVSVFILKLKSKILFVLQQQKSLEPLESYILAGPSSDKPFVGQFKLILQLEPKKYAYFVDNSNNIFNEDTKNDQGLVTIILIFTGLLGLPQITTLKAQQLLFDGRSLILLTLLPCFIAQSLAQFIRIQGQDKEDSIRWAQNIIGSSKKTANQKLGFMIIEQSNNYYNFYMTEKKKPPKGEEDESTIRLPLIYKRKCQFNGLPLHKTLRDKLQLAVEEGKLQTLQLWQEMGPIQMRSLMDALCDLNYQHLKVIRLWKIDLQDEGLRSICNYIDKMGTVQYLDLMDNKITSLGCEFLGKTLGGQKNSIVKLKLDNNEIKNQGLANLVVGLRQNGIIQKLSFNFCGITKDGVKYIQQILANINCRLRTLKLMGNFLQNQGAYEILRAVNNCGDRLQKLNLADVQINVLNYKQDIGDTIEQKIEKQLLSIIKTNQSIAKYNFRNNWIPDIVAKKLLNQVKDNKVIFLFDLPDTISHPLKEMHAEIMKKRKPKKKKGKSKKNTKKPKK